MDFAGILLIAIGLAMDSFAVSLSIGTTPNARTFRTIFRVFFHLGFIQGLLTFFGWLAGSTIASFIASFDHWVAMGLLAWVGYRMIQEGFDKDNKNYCNDPTRGWTLMSLCLATSIDAVAVGLSMALVDMNIYIASISITFVTFIFSIIGLRTGSLLGEKFGKKMEILGGIILIGIGTRVLVTHILG